MAFFLAGRIFGLTDGSTVQLTYPRSPHVFVASNLQKKNKTRSLFTVMSPSCWIVLNPSKFWKEIGTTTNFTLFPSPVLVFLASSRGMRLDLLNIRRILKHLWTCSFLTNYFWIVMTSAPLSSWKLTSHSFTSIKVDMALFDVLPMVFIAFRHDSPESLLSFSSSRMCTLSHFDWKWFLPLQFLHLLPHAGHSSFFIRCFSPQNLHFPVFSICASVFFFSCFESGFYIVWCFLDVLILYTLSQLPFISWNCLFACSYDWQIFIAFLISSSSSRNNSCCILPDVEKAIFSRIVRSSSSPKWHALDLTWSSVPNWSNGSKYFTDENLWLYATSIFLGLQYSLIFLNTIAGSFLSCSFSQIKW
mgnify:CR=1 FL=1